MKHFANWHLGVRNIFSIFQLFQFKNAWGTKHFWWWRLGVRHISTYHRRGYETFLRSPEKCTQPAMQGKKWTSPYPAKFCPENKPVVFYIRIILVRLSEFRDSQRRRSWFVKIRNIDFRLKEIVHEIVKQYSFGGASYMVNNLMKYWQLLPLSFVNEKMILDDNSRHLSNPAF